MLWTPLDLDILEDPAFIELEDEVPGAFWCWIRVIQQAKRVNQQGLVLRADGRPLTAKDLHRIHRATSLDAWQGILDRCVELELLVLDDGAYQVCDWRRWHKAPSDMPDQVAERVARHRAAKQAETLQEALHPPLHVTKGAARVARYRAAKRAEKNSPTPNAVQVSADVTDCNAGNGCNDSEQSRAEQSSTEQIKTKKSKSSSSTPGAKLAREARKIKSRREASGAVLNGCAVYPLPGVDSEALARAEAVFQASVQASRPP